MQVKYLTIKHHITYGVSIPGVEPGTLESEIRSSTHWATELPVPSNIRSTLELYLGCVCFPFLVTI